MKYEVRRMMDLIRYIVCIARSLDLARHSPSSLPLFAPHPWISFDSLTRDLA